MKIGSRLERIERRLGLDTDDGKPFLMWPSDDGTFIKVHGCRSLCDLVALVEAKGQADEERCRTEDELGIGGR